MAVMMSIFDVGLAISRLPMYWKERERESREGEKERRKRAKTGKQENKD